MAASSSQGWINWQTPGDLIIYSLEDLKGSDFKRFKDKLSDFSYGDKLPIPRGLLENADWITTKNLLIGTYGENGALDVMSKVFTHIDLLGPAKDFQERRTKIPKLETITTSKRFTEWRKEYMESMKEDFQWVKEYNARRGETVSLENIYINLQLIKGPQIMDENMHEKLNSGKGHLQNLKRKSDKYFPIEIQSLFDFDKEDKNDSIPKIVVLQGPAGIGKTMTSKKIMLDWASGNLYQDKLVFYLSCRELNTITGPIGLERLLSRTCKLQSLGDLVSILKDPGNHSKLLFIVDGFDELRWTLENKSEVCHDIFEETHKDLLLQRLFRKQILKQSSLIITTRPLALEKLYSFVDKSRDVEVMGFTKENCKEYFHNFFKNEDDADKALSIIKDNEVLFTMCAIPIVCWIVCTVLKPQIKQDLDLLQYKTATSVYLLYLKGLIKYHCRDQPTNTCLKKLCALAKEGILNQKILFEMEDLDRHGLSLSEVESVFLNENLFHLDIDTQTCYSFIHLSVQEFLAALYYVLDDGSANEEGTTGLREETSIPEICKGNSLSGMCLEHPHLASAVRFLFGLLNEKEVKNFSKSTGINISLPAREAMEEWLIRGCALTDFLFLLKPAFLHSEVFACLYETQDKEIIGKISGFSRLNLHGQLGAFLTGKDCFKPLCYCLQACENLQSLTFQFFILNSKYLEIISSQIHKCQSLRFENVILYRRDSLGKDKLISTGAFHAFHFLSAEEVPADLSWLTHPQSNIRILAFNSCNLTASSCNYICSFLRNNKLLHSLDLSGNSLQDMGVKILCEGLKEPDCTLKALSIMNCDLTFLSCDYLQSVLTVNRSLTTLDLTWNRLEDSGIKRICEGLKHPDCILQDLRFDYCYTTILCCEDLYSAISTNRTLSILHTKFNTEILESDSRFDGLRSLGCIVRHPGDLETKNGVTRIQQSIKIEYRNKDLQKPTFVFHVQV